MEPQGLAHPVWKTTLYKPGKRNKSCVLILIKHLHNEDYPDDVIATVAINDIIVYRACSFSCLWLGEWYLGVSKLLMVMSALECLHSEGESIDKPDASNGIQRMTSLQRQKQEPVKHIHI